MNGQTDREIDVCEWLAYAKVDRQAADTPFEAGLYSVCALHCPGDRAGHARYGGTVPVVFDETQLRELVEHYLAVVRQHINVRQAVLYGSYVYGTPHDDSDVDLIVLSDDFAVTPLLKRHQQLGWLAWQAGTDYIQPLGYTPKEFEQARDLSLLGEVRERGIVIYDAALEVAEPESI